MAFERLKRWAQQLKVEIVALWLVARDPATPLLAKIVAGFVAAYALSPIDLIPDVIPILGLLDDLILLPAGVWLALRLIPAEQMAAARIGANAIAERPVSRSAAAVIIMFWLFAISVTGILMVPLAE
jgi:uncharacterized membrane protein YkvA (DUF1232 family)